MAFLNYNKDEKLEFNYKRACGLWLIVVAVIISVATLTGGKQIINMPVFSIGYVISFISINMNKKVLNRLSNGYSNTFQNKVSLYAIFLLFILMFLLGGPFFATENWRLIWLGALMATALHFFPYYFANSSYISNNFATVHYELCLTSVLMALKKIVNIFQIQT